MDKKDESIIGKTVFICEASEADYCEEGEEYIEGSTNNCTWLKEGEFCHSKEECAYKRKHIITESTQKDLDLKRLASFVYNWCLQIDNVGSSWDDWDEYFKEAFYGRKKDDPEYDFCKIINKYRKMEIK